MKSAVLPTSRFETIRFNQGGLCEACYYLACLFAFRLQLPPSVTLRQFTGIRWRSDLDLRVNCLWLEHYGYDPGDPTKQFWKESQSVWFDDVVVATEYIGPIQK